MRRWIALGCWLIALALLGAHLATALRVDTDLPRFVLAQNDPWQNDLAELIRSSPAGQLVVIAVAAERSETAAEASRLLRKQLNSSGPFSSASRISRALERGLRSETIRSSVAITRTSFQASSASDSASRNGPGVVPPGTASVACPLLAQAPRSWSATSSARSRISVPRSG